MAKATQRIEIARIEQQTTADGLGGLAVLMLLLGIVPIFLAVMAETSAIRLAAWAAMWTGYNVFWGIMVLYGQRTVMVVTRAPPAVDEND